MATRTKVLEYWTRVTRAVIDDDGQPYLLVTTCCCEAPGGLRRVCARATGNKTPCRCACHQRKGGRR